MKKKQKKPTEHTPEQLAAPEPEPVPEPEPEQLAAPEPEPEPVREREPEPEPAPLPLSTSQEPEHCSVCGELRVCGRHELFRSAADFTVQVNGIAFAICTECGAKPETAEELRRRVDG